ncbi:MAG: 3-hydroxyacyl-CoA dehydrogenase family protein [Peptococcaceae bacterium]|jgi:3-hydroxybutyryl-CoA dehydrogenase|nr:3-hydroxyacyl-CoA dehydrogenase family protein [Peptococcaceae bacterium]
MKSAGDIKKIGVAGAGLMGSQIALNAAMSGYSVWLYDSFPSAVDKAKDWSEKYLADRVAKGKLERAKVTETLARFHLSKELAEAVGDADLVIEAIIEKQDVKEKFFRELDKLVAPDAIIATNSSFMVSSLFAGCVSNPRRLANLHYFNPALTMKLVEIVKGPHTADETARTLFDFVKSVNKVPVIIKKEVDGFIVNRIARAISNAALEIIELGVADPEDVDTAIENGLNHPMGPFRLMDLTGIDLTYYIATDAVNNGQTVPAYKILREKFEAGELGRKTGKGWYDY